MENRSNERVVWVDAAKIAACILIVTGHLFRGLSSSGILSGAVWSGVVRFLYFFHVQVFFFCSGFLYRRNTAPGAASWGRNVLKKLADLGVPYVCFTVVSYFLKVIFESDVNDPVHADLFVTLVARPEAPYWYLYILFFMFLLIPPVKGKNAVWITLAVSVLLYAVAETVDVGALPYFAKNLMKYTVWFALGMLLEEYRGALPALTPRRAAPFFLFVPAALAICAAGIYFPFLDLIMGVWGVAFTVSASALVSRKLKDARKTQYFSNLVMPVFLMHTLASPMVRTALLKIGVTSAPVHLICGFAAGIVLPVAVYLVMRALVIPEFIIYPRRTVRRLSSRNLRHT